MPNEPKTKVIFFEEILFLGALFLKVIFSGNLVFTQCYIILFFLQSAVHTIVNLGKIIFHFSIISLLKRHFLKEKEKKII